MQYFLPLPTEIFLKKLLHEERDYTRIIDAWPIEREEVINILLQYYRELGIFTVFPMQFSEMIKKDILIQLKINPTIKMRIAKIQKQLSASKRRGL